MDFASHIFLAVVLVITLRSFKPFPKLEIPLSLLRNDLLIN